MSLTIYYKFHNIVGCHNYVSVVWKLISGDCNNKEVVTTDPVFTMSRETSSRPLKKELFLLDNSNHEELGIQAFAKQLVNNDFIM